MAEPGLWVGRRRREGVGTTSGFLSLFEKSGHETDEQHGGVRIFKNRLPFAKWRICTFSFFPLVRCFGGMVKLWGLIIGPVLCIGMAFLGDGKRESMGLTGGRRT